MRVDVSMLFERFALMNRFRAEPRPAEDAPEAPLLPQAGSEGPIESPVENPARPELRSPATRNAFRRLESRLLNGVEGETRTSIEALLEEARDKAAVLSADDPRPYGKSVEHGLKQMLIRMIHGLGKHADSQPVETEVAPTPAPVPPEPPVEAAVDGAAPSLGGEAPYASGLDRTA